MVSTAPEYESKLIVLTDLKVEIEDAIQNKKKWVTVIDIEGNAEVFFKYQGTSIFSIQEKEINPDNLCRSLLTMTKYPRTLTINYLDLPYQDIFNEQFFPQNVLDPTWVYDFHNIEKLRQNFLQEFPEEVWPSKDFKMCFLFRKDNVPPLFHEKTVVIEICNPQEIGERLAKREEKAMAKKKAREEEKKFEEKKVEPAKPTNAKATTGAKTGVTAAKTTTTAAKTTTTAAKTTTTAAKTTTTAASKPAATTATKTTTTAASKPTTTTAPKTTTTTTAKPANKK